MLIEIRDNYEVVIRVPDSEDCDMKINLDIVKGIIKYLSGFILDQWDKPGTLIIRHEHDTDTEKGGD